MELGALDRLLRSERRRLPRFRGAPRWIERLARNTDRHAAHDLEQRQQQLDRLHRHAEHLQSLHQSDRIRERRQRTVAAVQRQRFAIGVAVAQRRDGNDLGLRHDAFDQHQHIDVRRILRRLRNSNGDAQRECGGRSDADAIHAVPISLQHGE